MLRWAAPADEFGRRDQIAVARDMPFGAALSFLLSLVVVLLLFAFGVEVPQP